MECSAYIHDARILVVTHSTDLNGRQLVLMTVPVLAVIAHVEIEAFEAVPPCPRCDLPLAPITLMTIRGHVGIKAVVQSHHRAVLPSSQLVITCPHFPPDQTRSDWTDTHSKMIDGSQRDVRSSSRSSHP